MPDDDATASANHTLRIVSVIIALVAAAVVYRVNHPRTVLAEDGRGGRWDAAIQHSREAHTPMLVVFTADWCPTCEALHSEVLCRDDVQNEIAGHYIMVTVDLTNPTSAASERAEKYGIRGIPTLIRFDAEGKETSRSHYLPPGKMIAWLRQGE